MKFPLIMKHVVQKARMKKEDVKTYKDNLKWIKISRKDFGEEERNDDAPEHANAAVYKKSDNIHL